MFENIAIIGSNGAIGCAFVTELIARYPKAKIHAFSRAPGNFQHPNIDWHCIDYQDETSIAEASAIAKADGPLDLVIVATGILHDETIKPEKSLRDLTFEQYQHIFMINTITPAMLGKYFLPTLSHQKTSVFAVLSARVGSISDNRLGGWYAYRQSKTALNQFIKTASIEMKRCNPSAMVIGLHPGTVDSPYLNLSSTM